MNKPNPHQQLISREELLEKLNDLLRRHVECEGYRVESVQVFAPGLIEHSNWRIAPPLDVHGMIEHSPCWRTIQQEVRSLQKRYKLPWP